MPHRLPGRFLLSQRRGTREPRDDRVDLAGDVCEGPQPGRAVFQSADADCQQTWSASGPVRAALSCGQQGTEGRDVGTDGAVHEQVGGSGLAVERILGEQAGGVEGQAVEDVRRTEPLAHRRTRAAVMRPAAPEAVHHRPDQALPEPSQEIDQVLPQFLDAAADRGVRRLQQRGQRLGPGLGLLTVERGKGHHDDGPLRQDERVTAHAADVEEDDRSVIACVNQLVERRRA